MKSKGNYAISCMIPDYRDYFELPLSRHCDKVSKERASLPGRRNRNNDQHREHAFS